LTVHFEDVYHLLQPSQRLDSQTLVSLLQTSLFYFRRLRWRRDDWRSMAVEISMRYTTLGKKV